jgi:hypothetical protein
LIPPPVLGFHPAIKKSDFGYAGKRQMKLNKKQAGKFAVPGKDG